MKTHELKTDPEVFDAVRSGRKTFEIRFNDRDFQHGDKLILRRTRFTGGQMRTSCCPLVYTEALSCVVCYILHGPIYGLDEGWCIMSIYDVAGLLPSGESVPEPKAEESVCPSFKCVDGRINIATGGNTWEERECPICHGTGSITKGDGV